MSGIPSSFYKRKRVEEPAAPACPGCGGELAVKESRSEKNAGRPYYTCGNTRCFPDQHKAFLGWVGEPFAPRVLREMRGAGPVPTTTVPAAAPPADAWIPDLLAKLDTIITILRDAGGGSPPQKTD